MGWWNDYGALALSADKEEMDYNWLNKRHGMDYSDEDSFGSRAQTTTAWAPTA